MNRRRVVHATLVVAGLCSCMALWLRGQRNPPIKKTILLWNGHQRIEMVAFGTGATTFSDHQCPVNHCLVTTERFSRPLDQFDAIIFNIPVLQHADLPPSESRRSHQRYVFFSQESPFYNLVDVDQFTDYFNWTMSFQKDSDILLTYGRVEVNHVVGPSAGSPPSGRNKTKLVAWFASHCDTQSRREKYVTELQKYINVDVYGGCGPLECVPSSNNSRHCYEMLERDYKFYLAFENSLCRDYVTEKLFVVLQYRVVPVVLGRGDYRSVAPTHSYIDALRFRPRQLADYLRRLDGQPELYERYFRWKRRFLVRAGYEDMAARAFCSLCAKLHVDRRPSVHHQLRTKLSPTTQCIGPQYLKILGID